MTTYYYRGQIFLFLIYSRRRLQPEADSVIPFTYKLWPYLEYNPMPVRCFRTGFPSLKIPGRYQYRNFLKCRREPVEGIMFT